MAVNGINGGYGIIDEFYDLLEDVVWKEMTKVEGKTITDDGRWLCSDGGIICHVVSGKPVYMYGYRSDHDYCLVNLTTEDGKRRPYRVHRIIWETFNGRIPKGLTINHRNENKCDNRLTNLEVLSNAENNRYGTKGARTSEKNGKPVKMVRPDGTVSLFKSIVSLKKYGICPQSVSDAIRLKSEYRGCTWSHISKKEYGNLMQLTLF